MEFFHFFAVENTLCLPGFYRLGIHVPLYTYLYKYEKEWGQRERESACLFFFFFNFSIFLVHKIRSGHARFFPFLPGSFFSFLVRI